MIMAVYEAEKAAGHENRPWLEKAYGYASKDYETWNRDPTSPDPLAFRAITILATVRPLRA